MKQILSLIALVAFSLIGGSVAATSFGVDSLSTTALIFTAGCFTPSVSGALMVATPATDVATIAKWAGQYSKTFLNDMLNGLDIFKDLVVDRLVSDHGKLLAKFSPSKGMRPFDSNVEDNGTKERNWSGRKLYVKYCMKLFRIIPAELRGSFLSDMIAPDAKEVPFAAWVWEKEMETLAAEINDNFYLQEFHADAADWDAGAVYTGGTSYMKFTDDNYYKCVTTTTAGQSPITNSAKWLNVNGLVSFNGPAKIIATEITAGNLVPIATGALTDANALTKIKLMYDAIPVPVRNKGGSFLVSPDVYQKYIDHEKAVYPNALNQDMGDGTKYVYGSGKKWVIKECSWMGTSGRVIVNVQNANLVVGTNLKETPGITNTIPILHGYKAIAQWSLGFEIADLAVLYVNDQA